MTGNSVCPKRILNGINYLVMEAENNGLEKIALILRICANDICLSIETGSAPHEVIGYLDSSLLAAIEFLSKFATIQDLDVKRKILVEIEKQMDNPGQETTHAVA